MKKILVIGDGCQDIFQYGTCERMCPEAPVPIFKPTSSTKNGGMSLNVLKNLRGLSVDADIVRNKELPTKTRFIDVESNQMLMRYDINDRVDYISLETLNKINYSLYDGVIISDYNKGFLAEDDISFIASRCKSEEVPIFLDTKKKINYPMIKNIDFIKINEKEFIENKSGFIGYDGHIIYTMGRKGAFHMNLINGRNQHFPIDDEHPVRDLSGAGDTFLAAFVVEYLDSHEIPSAINFANACASWVVTQKGVVSITIEKARELYCV